MRGILSNNNWPEFDYCNVPPTSAENPDKAGHDMSGHWYADR